MVLYNCITIRMIKNEKPISMFIKTAYRLFKIYTTNIMKIRISVSCFIQKLSVFYNYGN